MKLPQVLVPKEGTEWANSSVEGTINQIIRFLSTQNEKETNGAVEIVPGHLNIPQPCPDCVEDKRHHHKEEYTCKDDYKVHQGPCINCVSKEETKFQNKLKETIESVGAWDFKQEQKQIDVEALVIEYAKLWNDDNWTEEGKIRSQEIIKKLEQALQE